MADEPRDESAPEERDESRPKDTGKKPKPKFGQVLNLGGQFWTVQRAEDGAVTVSRKVGDGFESRKIDAREYERAAAVPLPANLAKQKPPKGISVGSYVDAGRVAGFDAASGEVLVESSKGSSWVSGKRVSGGSALYDDTDAASGPSGPTRIRRRGDQGDETEEKEGWVDRKVRENVSDLTFGLVGKEKARKTSVSGSAPSAPVEAPPTPAKPTEEREVSAESMEESLEEAEELLPEIVTKSMKASTPAARVSRTVKVGDAPKAATPSAVKVSATVPVGTPVKEPSIRETRVELKAEVEQAKSRAPVPSAVRMTAAVPAAPSTPAAAILGVAKAVVDTMPAEPAEDAARAQEQLRLYARAMNALQVVSSRAEEKRKSVQTLQDQAAALRSEIAGLNAQAAAPQAGAYRAPADVSERIARASSDLGNVSNKLALARYELQRDDAQAQQLKIATNLMRRTASEVQTGRVPKAVVGLVAQSIPADVPEPTPEQVTAFIASLSPTAPAVSEPAQEYVAAEPPPPRSYASAPPTAKAARPVETAGGGILSDATRARMPRGGLSLPQSTAVAFSAAQQADRMASYQEGLGSPDARETAFATAGGGAQPVMKSIQASYMKPAKPEEAEDVFAPGGAGVSEDFLERQREALETQEQFLPGTTGAPEATTFEPEATREQRVRTESEGPDEDMIRAAKMQAEIARSRAAALQAFETEQTEEGEGLVKKTESLRQQAEMVKRNYSRLMDLFNGSLGVATSETVIGAIVEFGAVLLNMNSRAFVALITYRNKKSVIRKIFPPAQFPVEFAFIVAADLLIFSVVFVNFCILIAPFVIFFVLTAGSIAGLLWAISS